MPQLIAFTLLAIAHAFDFVSFRMLVLRQGINAEANPIVSQIYQETGIGGLTIAKVATVVLAASIVVIVGRRHRALAAGLLLFGIAAGIVGGVSNLVTM